MPGSRSFDSNISLENLEFFFFFFSFAGGTMIKSPYVMILFLEPQEREYHEELGGFIWREENGGESAGSDSMIPGLRN